MTAFSDEASFTFSWLALKLLGRGLYSNPWSALSELVANGLDAGATTVYVYIDARNKSNAVVEVIDNGSGMSRDDIDTYVKVGYDKRKAASRTSFADAGPMGRKGIGKLAALFLSPHFYLSTRHVEGKSSWELDAREAEVNLDAYPSLTAVDSTPSTSNDEMWADLETGTRLTMLGVDLTGYGTQSVKALGTRLANQFLLPVNGTPQILFWVQESNVQTKDRYKPVKKSIAFGNLAEIVMNFPDSFPRPNELTSPVKDLKIPAKGLPGDIYTHTPRRSPMRVDPEDDEAWSEIATEVDPNNCTFLGVPYKLTGWIGVHATIDNSSAQVNDARFRKNKYYNPAELRVYVRGKLASDRLLSQLGLTGTYVNYIEGEISFDLLDEDSLPDIATSNRQDFDETDKRVTLLRALVRPLVRYLIQERNKLASQISTAINEEKQRRETASKRHFSEQVHADLKQHDEIPQSTRDELQMVITNKIQGNVKPKQSFRVFISHARTDRAFAGFIDDLIRTRGAKPEEIFFTSRTGATDVLLDAQALSEVVKRNITDDNTLIFYLTSKNFLASQFCLFEGGAGWATRSVSEYLKLNVEYDTIPGWLTNGRGEPALLGDDNTIELTPEIHNYLVDGVLNPMIAHLNRGRDIAGEQTIPSFTSADFPTELEMEKENKSKQDYFDPEIVAHWDTVVQRHMAGYLEQYFAPSAEAKQIKELEDENAQLRVQLKEPPTP
ncbi:ATP-binding protein [Brevibacterium ihuae]|uniref:ATP-binding protein n=1 Tax=Brevibacterium ihuae TaxID=1631743 RepID=UPI000C7582BB|nr:ATP-binding protein [Brevibacterium ihuae]